MYQIAKGFALLDEFAEASGVVLAKSATSFTWKHLLTVAPYSIVLLGQAMVVSNKRDFSLISKNESVQFVYVKYPSSFRATLTQLGNEHLMALQNAEKGVIRMSMVLGEICSKATEAHELLSGGSAEKLRLLKSKMSVIHKLIVQCVTASVAAEDAINRTQSLLDEILKQDMTALELGNAYNTAQEVLVYLGQLKTSWAKLSRFFAAQRNLTQSALQTDFNNLSAHVNQVEKVSGPFKDETNAAEAVNNSDTISKSNTRCYEYAFLEVSITSVHICKRMVNTF